MPKFLFLSYQSHHSILDFRLELSLTFSNRHSISTLQRRNIWALSEYLLLWRACRCFTLPSHLQLSLLPELRLTLPPRLSEVFLLRSDGLVLRHRLPLVCTSFAYAVGTKRQKEFGQKKKKQECLRLQNGQKFDIHASARLIIGQEDHMC